MATRIRTGTPLRDNPLPPAVPVEKEIKDAGGRCPRKQERKTTHTTVHHSTPSSHRHVETTLLFRITVARTQNTSCIQGHAMTHQRKMCSVASTFQCTRHLSHAVSVLQAVCRALPAHRQPNTVAEETRQARGTLKNVVIIEHVAHRLLLGTAVAVSIVSPTPSPKKPVWKEGRSRISKSFKISGKAFGHAVAPERGDVPRGHGS